MVGVGYRMARAHGFTYSQTCSSHLFGQACYNPVNCAATITDMIDVTSQAGNTPSYCTDE